MLTLWLILCVVVIETSKPEFSFSGNSFTNMVVHDGKIYIGAKNKIHVLNATNLNEVKEVVTCAGECDNVNKVLVINEKLEQLISCGTGHGGLCELRNLSSINNILDQSKNSSEGLTSYLVVSTNENRPAIFVTDTSELYTAVTYGGGHAITDSSSYNYYLAKYSLANNHFAKGEEDYLNLALSQTTDPLANLEDYLAYFQAGFQHNGFIYFFTNQKFKVGASTYSSKIIRVCENDTSFVSYTDILLKCEKDGIDYNLVQDVSVFEPGQGTLNNKKKIMAATFTTGFNPEHPEKFSAICLYRVEDIDRIIMEAKQSFIACPYTDLQPKERYLSDNRKKNQCLNTSTVSVCCLLLSLLYYFKHFLMVFMRSATRKYALWHMQKQQVIFVAPALAGRHRRASFRPFVRPSVHPSTFNMGILWAQLLLQFCIHCFETLHVFSSWYEDVHVDWT